MYIKASLESSKEDTLNIDKIDVSSLLSLVKEAIKDYHSTDITINMVNYKILGDVVEIETTVTGRDSLYCIMNLILQRGKAKNIVKVIINTYLNGMLLLETEIVEGILHFTTILNTQLKRIGA